MWAGGEMTTAGSEPSRSFKHYNHQGLMLVESRNYPFQTVNRHYDKRVLTHCKLGWEGWLV